MPLPFILGAAAAAAAIGGIGSGISGAVKMSDANDEMKAIESRHKRAIKRFEDTTRETNIAMDELGEFELEILQSFEEFSNTIEKIQNRPEFKEYIKDGIELPKYNREELKNASVGATILLGGITGGVLGTAGGFAAAGATTSAIMALGTASTGTAIASLSGAAATNATLAALGGGAIAAGGGGMALGSAILGAGTLGIGLLVGGVILNATGGKLSEKVEEARAEANKAKKTIDSACEYLNDLKDSAIKYKQSLSIANDKYTEQFSIVSHAVNDLNKADWNYFTSVEKNATQNAVLLVGLLYKMCQVSLVNKSENEAEINTVNKIGIDESISNANNVVNNL